MIEWVEELRAGFTEEFGTGPKIVTLATVDTRGQPRARSVVVRTLTDQGSLAVASDARSEKNQQVRYSGRAEVCCWLKQMRRQFRLECVATVSGESTVTTLEVDIEELRHQVWAEMSEASRATFSWPQPGDARIGDASAFPSAVRTGLPPDHFELLFLRPNYVDLLELTSHPHRRRVWRRSGPQWAVQELNP